MPKKITEIKGTTCDQIAEILKADPTLGWRPIELDHKIKDAEYPAILIQLKKLQEAGNRLYDLFFVA